MRSLVWPHLCGATAENEREENTGKYQELLTMELSQKDDTQIRKDLPRAFQTHIMFRSPKAGSRDLVCMGQAALYNVLKAYALRHADIGYVQGMSFLAGLCLM
jgi:TBC1 domain family protein 1